MIDDTVEDVISVWIGISHKSDDDFNAYTRDMESLHSGSPIQRDLGCGFIDSDFFVAYRSAGHALLPVERICEEVDCSPQTLARIVERCRELGITQANSLYYYCDCSFSEDPPGPLQDDNLYNGLRFIGVFADPDRRDFFERLAARR